MSTISLTKLIAVAGKLWEKGSHSRTYLRSDATAELLGFSWETYKSGNIKKSSFEGDDISHSEMYRVLAAINGVYIDNETGKFVNDKAFREMLDKYYIELVDDRGEEEVEEEETDEEDSVPSGHGGARPGAGRKPGDTMPVMVRLTKPQKELLDTMGGSRFLRNLFDEIEKKRIPVPVDTKRLTVEEQDAFIRGWKEAGGDTDDSSDDDLLYAPWTDEQPIIYVTGTSPFEWGADWLRQCRKEKPRT